jgi:pentatricopeptide repeat domain-containing protein 1
MRFISRRTLHNGKTQECTSIFKDNCHQHFATAKKFTSSTTIITSNTKTMSHVNGIEKHQREQEFLVRLKNDPDSFGDTEEKEMFDELDLKEEKYLEEQPLPSQKLSTKQYANIIKAYIQKRQIKEALNVLEVKMLKEDRCKPENYIFNLLLGACGRVGYTKKAFSLYNQMKKRGLKVTGGTYTALFNACANSPWPDDGLSRAQHLRNIMIEKAYEPNDTNYNAMIKAFGRCGDLSTAFNLVDEMASKNFNIKDDTMNFLLQACIQDKDAGFRHALLVWRKLINKNITPSFYTYNLMLRCIRDCGIGNIEVMNDVLQTILNQDNFRLNTVNNQLLCEKHSSQKLLTTDETNNNNNNLQHVTSQGKESDYGITNVKLMVEDSNRPNLMAKIPHLGNIISLTEVQKAEDRLLLVGGFKGFLNNMMENQCTPDIKTFTQLLDCLPGSLTSEKELIKTMKKWNVRPDIDFFNMLIKKRSMRFDYESAKAVLKEMKEWNYRPNLLTYGVLSLGCKTKEEALALLTEMKEHSYRLNTEILGAMLHQACSHKNFSYVLEIMEISLREDVKPNKIFMKRLEDFKKKCKDISNDKDNTLYHNKSFQKGFRIFQMRYKTWLEQVEIDDSDNIHPWTQYRQTIDTDVKHYKDKSQKFKARHLSKFKVKTSMKHR